MKKLSFLTNDEIIFKYDRDNPINDQQLTFLNKMDADLDRGFKINGELIVSTDIKQRARFIVLNLIKALQQDNQAIVSASCAWLVKRLPALYEVHINKQDDSVSIELIEEH